MVCKFKTDKNWLSQQCKMTHVRCLENWLILYNLISLSMSASLDLESSTFGNNCWSWWWLLPMALKEVSLGVCVYLCMLSHDLSCDPMDCSPPGSSVHGVFQAVTLEWVAISLSRGIFPTQGSNPHLLHSQADSLPLPHQGIPPVSLQDVIFNSAW